MSREKYYVYKVFLEGEVIYVGKGQGNRCNHVLSGRSHNAKLNEYYYRHTLLGETAPIVKKVKHFSEESLALGYESYLIKDLLPDCNVRGTKSNTLIEKKITSVKNKPKVKKVKSVKKVKPVPTFIEEDNIIDLPENYEDFLSYAKNIYDEVSESWKNPQTFRTWLKCKKILKSWYCFHEFIDTYLDSTPSERENNGGHNVDSLNKSYTLNKKQNQNYRSWKTYFRKTKNREPSEEECIKKITKLKEKYND